MHLIRCLEDLRFLMIPGRNLSQNVSHELKTPLTSMKVLADSLLAQEGAPAELYQEFYGGYRGRNRAGE